MKNDNFVSLSKKLSDLGSKLIIESLDLIEKKNYKFTDQDEKKQHMQKKLTKKNQKLIGMKHQAKFYQK